MIDKKNSLNNVIESMNDKELINLIDYLKEWCYLDANDNPCISLNGIKRAIEILEKNPS